MKILELFSGTKSIAKVFRKAGHEVFTVDNDPELQPDLCIDMLDLKSLILKESFILPFTPDVIWASPPCTAFSVAAIGHNWGGGAGAYIPKSEGAKLGIELVEATKEIIKFYEKKNKSLLWFIENPRGVLRKLPVMVNVPRHSISYCRYGDTRMKPTDIWTNSDFNPLPMCKNGNPDHEAAPRGSRTGTQGLKNATERGRIPEKFCESIVKMCESKKAVDNK